MVNLSKCQLTRQKPSKPPQIIHPQKISSANIRKYQAKYQANIRQKQAANFYQVIFACN